ncbi:MAG: GWxTD domain-containing protein [bacterium]|nr:MAG: GWxTD domain-containing protein [bacterium]
MFSKNILIFLFFIYLFSLYTISAQTSQEIDVAAEKLNFGFDISRFRAQDDFVMVEIYYSIFRNYLKFEPEEDRWKAAFNFKAEIWQNDSLLATDQWQNVDYVDSLEHITPGQKLFGMGYFAVKPGNYKLKVILTDINSNYERKKEKAISIEPIPEDKLTLSDIQLASQIKSSTEKGRFYKNGYMVISNPDQFYGTGMPMLMFYNEIYNLCDDANPDTGNYSVQYRILDSDGQPVREFPSKVKKKPGESAVEVSGMNIISFRSGTYFLELEVNNLVNNEKATKKKKFFIYREGDLAISDSVAQQISAERLRASLARIYQNMSAENLDEEFDAAAYIATREEKNIFKTLAVQGKQKFLIEFWQKRDTSPETPQNEYRNDYLKLVNTANKEFSGFKKGYKSDRGRVLLVYGVPDEIERFPLNMEHKEHHIWKFFSIQGGVIFIFVDKQGFGNLELVHSTARGELTDPDWQRWIDPNR